MHVLDAKSTDIPVVRRLFHDYAKELGVDLEFQGFRSELGSLPGEYAPPRGRLLLAKHAQAVVGCIALRDLGSGTCEMKRLYVQPSVRCNGAGRVLVARLLEEARRIGYRRMVLDTLEHMIPARRLYSSFGFKEISAYYPNPLPGAVYMEIDLNSSDAG